LRDQTKRHDYAERIGETVEVQTAGEELPHGHGQQRGEQRWEDAHGQRVDRREDEPEGGPDHREPRRGAAEVLEAGVAATGQRQDRQVADGQQGARHGRMLARCKKFTRAQEVV